ncbi:O-antigen ligase family protein [Psychrosphaera algicola]|uniref:O-antigen ligase family protein n=1 Tax=Psychrosphaera algicola TaxID=3023714 RepID=UPI00351CDDBD
MVGLYYYESRASLGMVFISLFSFLIASLSNFKLMRVIWFFLISCCLAVLFLSSLSGFQELFQSTTDLERNHSNIERMSMYLFTIEYLFSDTQSYGLGNLGLAMADMKRAGVIYGVYPHPHSSYLRFALEFGWTGIIGLCSFYIFLIIKSLRLYKVAPREAIILIIATFNLIVFSFVGCIFFHFIVLQQYY